VRRTDFDVVLMDVQMPEARRHRGDAADPGAGAAQCAVPIIALTAHAMSGAREAVPCRGNG